MFVGMPYSCRKVQGCLLEIDVGGILIEDGVKKKRHEGVIDNVTVYSSKECISDSYHSPKKISQCGTIQRV